MLKNCGTSCLSFRSLSVSNAAPWCREINGTLKRCCQRRRPVLVEGKKRSFSFHQSGTKGNIYRYSDGDTFRSPRWKLKAITATVLSGVFFDNLGMDVGDEEDKDSGRNSSDNMQKPSRIIPRVPTRLTRMTNRRHESSFRITLGESVMVDRNVVDEASSRTVAHEKSIALVLPEDEDTISPFLFYLMQQTTLVRISENDRSLYRLPLGLPGIACVHCQQEQDDSYRKLKARCEIYPMDRRTLPAQVRRNLYYHIRKCDKCPPEVKLELKRLQKLEPGQKISREERLFFKKLWFRMGHKVEL